LLQCLPNQPHRAELTGLVTASAPAMRLCLVTAKLVKLAVFAFNFAGFIMPSFDTVCEANMVDVKNAVEQTNKVVTNRFDLKGTSAKVEQKERELTLYADSDFHLDQVRTELTMTMGKRNVDVRFLDEGKVEKIGGDKVKQVIKVRNGIESDQAKKIVKIIKDSKLKVQAAIQGEAVRVTGAKRDILQETIALLRKEVKDLPLEFNNFRD